MTEAYRAGDTSGGALVLTARPAHIAVGSIVAAKRGFRRENAVVLGVGGGDYEVVWQDGQSEKIRASKVKATLAAPTSALRSVPGRLLGLLRSSQTTMVLSEPMRFLIRDYIGLCTADQAHALGFLLDHATLGLDLRDYLTLPLEPWRVRYEFIATVPVDAHSRAIARDIILDAQAPTVVRSLVALKFGLQSQKATHSAERLFDQPSQADAGQTLDVATLWQHELAALPGDYGARLDEALKTPGKLAKSSEAATLLAALAPHSDAPSTITVSPDTRMRFVDDLIERGVTVRVASGSAMSGSAVMTTYITARTDPSALSLHQISALGFEVEARRRYVGGDQRFETMLSDEYLGDAQAILAARTGNLSPSNASDPQLQELMAVLGSDGRQHASNLLLEDRSVWKALITAGVSGRAVSATALSLEFSELSALNRASAALYEWLWDDALAISREGLRLAQREAVRDELLNIIACALWLQDDYEPALAALDQALEGEYSDALLINASIIALALDHDSAVARLVRLAREAPSTHQRAIAAESALLLWANEERNEWDDDDEASAVPAEILDALRPLLKEDLSADRYLTILRVMSAHDAAWLARQPNSAFGENASLAATRVFQARAKSLEHFIKALAAEASKPNAEQWVKDECDSLVDSVLGVLLESFSELGAAALGFTLLDNRFPMPPKQFVALTCLTVSSISLNALTEDSEPNMRVLKFLENASKTYDQLEPLEQAAVEPLLEIAVAQVARTYMAHREEPLDNALRAAQMIVMTVQNAPRRQLNMDVVRQNVRGLKELNVECQRLLKRLQALARDATLKASIRELLVTTNAIDRTIGGIRQ